jgi:hypothetical protein
VGRRSIQRRILLATSSVVALAAGGPSAWAACATITGNSAGFTNPSGTTIDCIHIVNGTVTGNVVNAGTLSPGGPFGISVDQTSTVSGAIVNTGVISAARGLQDVGRMTGGFNNSGTITGGEAVFIDGQTALAPTFLGGITNTGTMTASGTNGIFLSPTIFSGGISNGGTISGGTNGIAFIFTTLASPATTPNTFTGGVANTGTITAAGGDAIHLTGGRLSGAPVTAEGTFSGGIVNSGVLSGSANGVYVASFREFGGGIANNLGGSITASGGDGILVDLVTTGGIQAAITNFAGGVTNAGRITASANGIRLLGISSFSGSVSNSGTITANGGDGFRVDHASYAGTISNSGTITASVNGIFVSNTVENAVATVGPSMQAAAPAYPSREIHSSAASPTAVQSRRRRVLLAFLSRPASRFQGASPIPDRSPQRAPDPLASTSPRPQLSWAASPTPAH